MKEAIQSVRFKEPVMCGPRGAVKTASAKEFVLSAEGPLVRCEWKGETNTPDESTLTYVPFSNVEHLRMERPVPEKKAGVK